MLRNYFEITIRNLFRNKAYAFITISGIAIGLTAAWLISLCMADELGYERFHKNADRVVRVTQHMKWDGGRIHQAST